MNKQKYIEMLQFEIERLEKNKASGNPCAKLHAEFVLSSHRVALSALTAEPVYWEIAGNLFTTREDALKPGFRGTPEPLYEELTVEVSL
ncbi:Uncharacterised protein [Yersinia similis]|uniref:Uncharacterized protein n=1 Tax=Yersinia similis TaxID=367190 RepID=A0A0T9QKZ3_9GAMM|nr:hypothetical protein [Yersinia similis]CNI16947.1 Uncharacterised protein [Yersinia similis]